MSSLLLKCCHLWLKRSFKPFPSYSTTWLERSTKLIRDPPVLRGQKRKNESFKTMYFPPPLSTFPSILLLSPSSCVVKLDVKSSPNLALMLLSLTMWLQEVVAISSPSTVAKPHSDASKQNCDPPLPARSPAGSEKQLGCSSVRCIMEGREVRKRKETRIKQKLNKCTE